MLSIRNRLIAAAKNSTKNHTQFHTSTTPRYPLTKMEEFRYVMDNMSYIEEQKQKRTLAALVSFGIFGALFALSGKENPKKNKNESPTASSAPQATEEKNVLKKP